MLKPTWGLFVRNKLTLSPFWLNPVIERTKKGEILSFSILSDCWRCSVALHKTWNFRKLVITAANISVLCWLPFGCGFFLKTGGLWCRRPYIEAWSLMRALVAPSALINTYGCHLSIMSKWPKHFFHHALHGQKVRRHLSFHNISERCNHILWGSGIRELTNCADEMVQTVILWVDTNISV